MVDKVLRLAAQRKSEKLKQAIGKYINILLIQCFNLVFKATEILKVMKKSALGKQKKRLLRRETMKTKLLKKLKKIFLKRKLMQYPKMDIKEIAIKLFRKSWIRKQN